MIPTELLQTVIGLAFFAVWVMAGDIVLHDRPLSSNHADMTSSEPLNGRE
jgi:hypothetical protein